MRLRMWFVVVLMMLSGCSFGRPATSRQTSTPVVSSPTTVVVTPSAVPSSTPLPAATQTPLPAMTTLRVRIIAADAQSYAPMTEIIERAATAAGLDVVVDIRSPDGALALQQDLLPNDVVDVWIANAIEVWQLDQRGAISTAPITSDIPNYPFANDGLADFVNRGVAPIAAQNYFIGIYNTEILRSAPTTVNQLQSMPGLLVRPRYLMAFPWAEGRWFDAMMQEFGATSVLTDGVQSVESDAAVQALQTLVDLRNLGPNDATTYQISTTDFLYSRVPYTIDGDAALRRFAVFSDTLLLDYALPPVFDATETIWLPDVDVVYAVVPSDVATERRAQVLQLINQLQRTEIQRALYTQMRFIPVRSDVLPTQQEDPLARVLDQVAQFAGAQRYDDAVVCRWDSYERVLPFALLNMWRVSAAVDSLKEFLSECPPVDDI